MKHTGYFKRRTKILCTVGPATGTASAIERLARSGMNIARLNLSLGTHDVRAQYIRTVRRMSQRLRIPVALLMDLPGPKYRTVKLKDGRALLKKGALMTLTAGDIREMRQTLE